MASKFPESSGEEEESVPSASDGAAHGQAPGWSEMKRNPVLEVDRLSKEVEELNKTLRGADLSSIIAGLRQASLNLPPVNRGRRLEEQVTTRPDESTPKLTGQVRKRYEDTREGPGVTKGSDIL